METCDVASSEHLACYQFKHHHPWQYESALEHVELWVSSEDSINAEQ